MNEYLLLFRMNITDKEAQPSQEQQELYMTQWGEWINSISQQDKLADGGNHLSTEGKVLKKDDVIVDGPYTEKKESLAGYIIIKSINLEEAVSLAKNCPILLGEGTSVEVRKLAALQ